MFALHRTRRRVGEPANVGRRRACRINPLPRLGVEPLPDAAMRWAPRTLAPNAAEDIANATLRLIAAPKNPDDPRYRKHLLHFYWGKKPAHIR